MPSQPFLVLAAATLLPGASSFRQVSSYLGLQNPSIAYRSAVSINSARILRGRPQLQADDDVPGDVNETPPIDVQVTETEPEAADKDDYYAQLDALYQALEQVGGQFGLETPSSSATTINQAVDDLQAASVGSSPMFPDDLPEIAGRWTLLYSSAFASTGSLGGQRPGPSAAQLPLKLAAVFQDIRLEPGSTTGRLDNIVEVTSELPLPLPPPTVVLGHSLQVESEGSARIRIVNDEFSLTPDTSQGGEPPPLGLEALGGWYSKAREIIPPISLPNPLGEVTRQLEQLFPDSPLSQFGTFDTVYNDGSLRITRGDREEIRIFQRKY